jgi:Flp pilus assembly protein TadD
MGLKDWPAAGFPGTAVNPRTLQVEVVDQEACTAALSCSNDPADAVFVLLAEGRTAEAAELAAQARIADPGSFRLQVLDADILGATRRTDRALELLRRLTADVAGTPREAVLHQVQGHVHFGAGQYAAAVQSFTRALNQRVANGSDAGSIYSSTVALQRASDCAETAAP